MAKAKKNREIRCFTARFTNPDIEEDGNPQLLIKQTGIRVFLSLSEMAAVGWKLDHLLQRDPIRLPDKFTAIMSRKCSQREQKEGTEEEKHGD